MESLFNSTFDHNGKKAVVPYATEADVQGLLTMLFTNWLSGGNPPLKMKFTIYTTSSRSISPDPLQSPHIGGG